MADRPIIFSGPMVRALLDERKTQTRRVLKDQPGDAARGCYHRPDGRWIWVSAPRLGNGVGYDGVGVTDPFRLPYAPGDRLWVQEDWRTVSSLDRDTPSQMRAAAFEAGYLRAWAPIRYEADGARDNWESGDDQGRRRWSRHMIREFSRLTLIVTDVRVQRLQQITDTDAEHEGCFWDCAGEFSRSPREVFANLWNSLHGPDAWDQNPWVAALTFTVHRQNIDQMTP